MQYIKIDSNETLSSLSRSVGARNMQTLLSENYLPRVRELGKYIKSRKQSTTATPNVSPQAKMKILNTFSVDSEIFEKAALSTEDDWKTLHQYHHFNDALKVPEGVELPNSDRIIHSGECISDLKYRRTVNSLSNPPYKIDPDIFNSYRNTKDIHSANIPGGTSADIFQLFKFPWGKIRLFDSITSQYIDFPVYPEEISDSRGASYTTLGDILYEYEPWNIYTNSGPRTGSYTFMFHRQMWTGDERDGKANELVRFCESCCYPDYRGSAVHTPTVKLFIEGKVFISGILTNVSTTWSGPIGLDGWYLICSLQLDITEVSEYALNHNSVRSIGTIG